MLNLKLRFKNKATLVALTAAAVSLVYMVLGMAGVVPGISQDRVLEAVALVINILVMLGIVVDPTTEGVSDSARAMGYDEPNEG